MSTALTVGVVSLLWVLLWSAVFVYEDGRGERRVLLLVRSAIDRGAYAVHRLWLWVFRWWDSGRVRLFLHFLVHTVLRTCLQLVRKTERGVESLLRQNKHQAKKIQFSEYESTSHLAEIAKHKHNTSPRTRRRRHTE